MPMRRDDARELSRARWLRPSATFFAALMAACAPGAAEEPLCMVPERLGELPPELAESSGIAASRDHPGVFWTHNDSGGEPVVFAVDSTGAVLGQTRVTGAENVDWEDIALGPCPAGTCLYIGEIGDNREVREDIAVYRIPEPDPGDDATPPAEHFPIRYPEGPQDAEALFVLPSGDVFVVTKARSRPVAIYRYAAPLAAGERVQLERVQALTDAVAPIPMQVTAAGASPGGRWVAVRSYVTLQLYRRTDGGFVPVLEPPGTSLGPLAEPQGEGVDLRADGSVVLTSEAGGAGARGPISRIRCTLP